MVVRRTKKVNKYRAHTTHGGGHRKKRRGAGSRGGRGLAGSGKRAGHKRQGITLGKSGFNPRRTKSKIKVLSVRDLTPKLVQSFIEKGSASKKEDVFVIDLNSLGYSKLIGTGSTTLKLELKIGVFTDKAKTKIESSGGKIINDDNSSD